MKKKVFFSGSKAFVEGSIYAGCRYYYGCPSILNSLILNNMSVRLPEVNGIFVQAENDASAINMALGSSISGGQVLVSATTDGIFSMQNGLNYLCGLEIPCVIGNIMSGRFGLRNYEPTQSGYIQAVRGRESVNYKSIVLAPHTVQEMYDIAIKAFELTNKYRNPVIVLFDSALSQMEEKLEIEIEIPILDLEKKSWHLTGAKNRKPNIYKSYQNDNSDKFKTIFEKFGLLKNETMAEEFMTEDAEEIIIAFGLMAKIIKGFIISARANGRKIGLFRPITISPFPKKELISLSNRVKKFTVVEANRGSMYIDVINILQKVGKEDLNVSFLGETESSIGFRNIISEFEKVFV